MKSPKGPHSGELKEWWEDPEDPAHILNKCAPAMLDLWKDPDVEQRLAEKRLRLEESSGCKFHALPYLVLFLNVSNPQLSGRDPADYGKEVHSNGWFAEQPFLSPSY